MLVTVVVWQQSFPKFWVWDNILHIHVKMLEKKLKDVKKAKNMEK